MLPAPALPGTALKLPVSCEPLHRPTVAVALESGAEAAIASPAPAPASAIRLKRLIGPRILRHTSAVLDLARLRDELHAACADAAIDPSALVVWVVDAVRPNGTTPLAYLQPAGEVRDDTVAVFRAVGAARAREFEGAAHRLALWGSLPGIPEAALGPMLRHELEHAARWERSGPRFISGTTAMVRTLRSTCAGRQTAAIAPARSRAAPTTSHRREMRGRAGDGMDGAGAAPSAGERAKEGA